MPRHPSLHEEVCKLPLRALSSWGCLGSAGGGQVRPVPLASGLLPLAAPEGLICENRWGLQLFPELSPVCPGF